MSRFDNKYLAIAFAAINAALSSVALLFPDNYDLVTVLAVFSFGFFAVICLCEIGNILFLARTAILGLIGYFPMAVKVIVGEDALFSGYERSTQGFDIVVLMYVTTSLALLSNEIGLSVSKRGRTLSQGFIRIRPKRLPRTIGDTQITYWWTAGMFGVILSVISAYLFVRAYGASILIAGYGSPERGGAGLPFGTVGVLGAVGIFSLFVAGMKGDIYRWKLVFAVVFAAFVVYSQLLMGPRQDAMSVLFGLVVLYGVARRQEIGLKLSYIPLLVAAYVFFEVWGIARTALAEGVPILTIATSAFSSMVDSSVVRLGTVSPIATTFSNTVFLVENKIIDLSLGKSYLEWLLRIPPEALYPDRPRDYAWMFEDHGLLAGGGFFELAEVYMNFGTVGALVIPGIISFLMGKAYYYAMERQSMLSYFLLFSFLAVFLRGTWYQTFAFFKSFLVCILLYAIYIFFVQALRLSVRPQELQKVIQRH